MLGLKRGTVAVVPYSPDWARAFAEEKARLEEAVGDQVLDIQHVGSTSIPGMAAKPILDIGIAVESFEGARVCIKPIEDLGYEFRGEGGIEGRHYFVKGEPRTHHIHMLEPANRDWQTLIRFRDTLIGSPELAAEYAALKRDLAARHPNDRPTYQSGKDAFIERVLAEGR